MQAKEMQELLLSVMPQWYCYIAKPFKHLMQSGVSLDMYYCIRLLRSLGDDNSMTELSRRMHMPKQQMTKLVDRLIDLHFVERVADPNDRRLVRLRLTEDAETYIDRFLLEDAAYYRELFDGMTPDDRAKFFDALRTLHDVFDALPKSTTGENNHD